MFSKVQYIDDSLVDFSVIFFISDPCEFPIGTYEKRHLGFAILISFAALKLKDISLQFKF
jgi:hypothetical protein